MRLRSVSGKLYGRDRELSELRQVYQQVLEEGTSRLVLLQGYSGNGKTSLVCHFGASIQSEACFIKGKFGEQNPKPYAAFSQAFQELVGYLLLHRDQEQARIEAIRQAVGSEWEVLKEVVPNLPELLGVKQAGEEELGPFANSPRNSVNRAMITKMNQFQFRFKSFVRAACSTSPVVIYLDDLHWSDMSSLELVKAILSDGESRNLLLVGSFRGHELHENHPLYWTLAHLQNKDYCGAQITEMELSDFTLEDLNLFLADSLELSPEKTLSLAQIIKRKTNGNAFYSKQLLQHLVHEKLVRYDMTYYQWTWEVEEIAGATDLSDNVVELVASRIQQLPPSVTKILKYASCLWYSFEVPVLEVILANAEKRLEEKGGSMRFALEDSREFSAELFKQVDKEHQFEVLRGLRIAAEQGLLDEMGTNGFKFAHDRIREATYSLILEGKERDSMHLVIGELLWCMFLSEQSQQWMLFSSVDQLNKVSYQFHDVLLRCELAEINLEAAEHAIAVSAFLPAIQYLKSGILFLGDDPWSQHYKLCLTLHSKAASLESSVGRPEDSKLFVDAILENAQSFDDKLSAYATRVESLCIGGKLRESLTLAVEVLEGLGETFPDKTNGKLFRRKVQSDTVLTQKMLSKHTDATILALPPMRDRKKEYVLRIANVVVDAAFHLGEMDLLFLIINRMVRVSLEYGLGETSGVAFALYGFALDSKNGDRRENFRYGKLALLIQERDQSISRSISRWECRILVFVYVLLNHWQEPLHKSLEPLLTAHKKGLECGDSDYAFQAAGAFYTLLWYGGNDLKNGVDDMRKFCAQMREYKQDKALGIYLPLFQCLLNMTGSSSKASILSGEAISEDDYAQMKSSNSTVQSYSMQLAYYFDDLELAEEMSTKLQAVSKSFNSHYLFVARKFFFGLIGIRVAMECKGKQKQRSNIKLARRIIEELELWSANGGLNCLHKLLILKAELKAFEFMNMKRLWFAKKESTETIRLAYDTAIATAVRSGFRNDAALACERASLFLDQCGEDNYWVDSYMSRALEYYKSWGAKAKVEHLRARQSRQRLFSNLSGSGTFRVDGQNTFRRTCVEIHGKVRVPHTNVDMMKKCSVGPPKSTARFCSGALAAVATKNRRLGRNRAASRGNDETNSTLEASNWSQSSLVKATSHRSAMVCDEENACGG